jgi:hypothetical protein
MPWEDGRKYGSFKKILIPLENLEEEANGIFNSLCQLEKSFYKNTVSGAETCFQFLLLYLKSRLGERAFLKTGKPLASEGDSLAFLESVRFFGMPDTVRQALFHWRTGEWRIELVDFHPSGKEMLYAQSQGYRLTTIDWGACKSGTLVENKRDGFEHLLHDLSHAFMFFRADYDYLGQVDFFKRMYEEFNQFESHLKSNLLFKQKFEYCISDMNSHPAHLEAYWTAIKREAGIQKMSN